MTFEDIFARIRLLLSDMENQPKDSHEFLEQLHLELNQLKVTGQRLPDDLVGLEAWLEQELEAKANRKQR